MNQESVIKRIIKIKDIMRLFFQYEVDDLPVLDKRNKFKGLINKNLIIQDATDSGFIEKSFSKLVARYLSYPDEEKFLFFVSNLSDDFKFPVIDKKGNFLFLWDKKQLLNCYYNISAKDKKVDKTEDIFYREILNILPFNILLTDLKNKIIFANKSFIKDFDFELNILLDHNLNKFFPGINMVLAKQNLFPKIYSMKYRHLRWYYTVLKYRTAHIYIFSLIEERLKKQSRDFLRSIDNIEIRSRRKDIKKKEDKEENKSLPDIIKNQETEIIKKVLQDNKWNITRAAKRLNIPRQTLQYKISKHKII